MVFLSSEPDFSNHHNFPITVTYQSKKQSHILPIAKCTLQKFCFPHCAANICANIFTYMEKVRGISQAVKTSKNSFGNKADFSFC